MFPVFCVDSRGCKDEVLGWAYMDSLFECFGSFLSSNVGWMQAISRVKDVALSVDVNNTLCLLGPAPAVGHAYERNL